MSIGFPEIMMILLIALLVFGPKKLPEIGRIIGRTIHELRRASSELTSSIQNMDVDEEPDIDDISDIDKEPKNVDNSEINKESETEKDSTYDEGKDDDKQ